ncbi:uncharacterized protein LOC112569905 isoform X1 [Pomacea canaliculata]|uniref:uncharacterized protein LOC112569905 isoform X1 n=1 Tax=Pomacea canaliculata TaxID=400727 RepID=UPI000D73D56A|nr:uncharacterized protein LOC112569905 isoform X1 [Pomacea canaliculata]
MYRAKTSYDFYDDELDDDVQGLPFTPLSLRRTPTGVFRSPSPPWSPRGEQYVSRPRSRTPLTLPGADTDMGWPRQVNDTGAPDNPYTCPMDPVNRQYYYRQWRRNPPRPLMPVYREGRLGGPWRHIKACVNSVGSHFAFIDGNVKSEENFFYPPESTLEPPSSSFYVTPRLVPLQKSSSSPPTRRSVERDSAYSQRARCGFKYWPQEPKPIDLAARYRQKARMMSLGLTCTS